jgi:ferrous iron transport protein B
VPVTLALNMMDELRARRIHLDVEQLAERLGVPVAPTVATRRRGTKALVRALPAARVPRLAVRYAADIEAAVAEIEALLPPGLGRRRGLAVMLAAGDETLAGWVRTHLAPPAIARLDAIIADLRRRRPDGVAYAIHRERLAAVDTLLAAAMSGADPGSPGLAARLGAWAMHPVWGVFVLAAVLTALYQFVGVFGAGTLVGWIEEGLFGRLINPAATRAAALIPVPFVRDLLVGEYGLITMALTYGIAIVLPIVFTFFIAFSLLEDSGYLPRLAVMVNRIFQGMGLNGKAVLPMVLGLGCDTMATLTTRILDRPKERLLVTLLLALGVPCSAQLGVIFGMLGRAGVAATVLWGGIVLAILFGVGFLAARVLPGESSRFVLELPPMRRPQLMNIVVKTMARVEWYLREALPLFLVGTLLLFVLDRLAFLALVERAAAPVVVGLLGLPADAARAFIMGFLRRDYGAAGFFQLQADGILDPVQVVVALVTMTLFIPCIANWFMMIKERGLKATLWMTAFILPFALLAGGAVNFALRALGVTCGGPR